MGRMESQFRFVAPPSPCGYLPDRSAQYENDIVSAATPADYFERMAQGWRRFGHVFFRPVCRTCRACESLRVDVARFRPSRSQRRNRKHNESVVALRIGKPSVTPEKLELYDRYHAFQADHKGWPGHAPKDAADYYAAFVENPFPTEEWCYHLYGRLVAVGYVDHLPGGLSAIYFIHDPAERERALGIWNVLSVIDRAAALGIPHVYLGYFVEGSPSMAYKADFTPNEILGPDGRWAPFRS